MNWLEITLLVIVFAVTVPVWLPALVIIGSFAFAFFAYIGAMLALAGIAMLAIFLLPVAWIGQAVACIRRWNRRENDG